MTHEPGTHGVVSGTERQPETQSSKPQYDRPEVRLINEEEALCAFQVLLSARRAG